MSSINKTNVKDLFDEYSKTRSMELRNQIVEHYLYMIDILIRKYLNKGMEYEDLYQVGSMALVFAVERFDASKGFEFTSFATPTIIGEIKRYFRDKGWMIKVPRRLKEISAQLPKAKEALSAKLHRAPTVKELSNYLGHTEEQILEAMESGQSYGAFSLNQTFDDSQEEGEGAVFEKYMGVEDSGFSSFEDAELIKGVLVQLDEQERQLFQKRFLQNKTQQQIAEEFGVSQMTISRIEKKLRGRFKEAWRI
ncbi:SigB/SigF/SigG family RNA polymerase sigma factor [Sinanaerobacter sp. ZZT-01]|uniref:SigB/SigF/SigG family RNA polymerase sigma factor n=1 Tax=Sinanaerobacter sp. ZZT-01 TaxID=3111540 RepID=UPI002D76F5ED|nr:SigB/SigF/SigG family RNA polymerase sigma factor [Sinanaerobacter sp. ZZT-01]WRR94772.1 SigB/SigF/SigG family RNA polymerase sigma factor [Sinanaerobacter sp. ZZT-01]